MKKLISATTLTGIVDHLKTYSVRYAIATTVAGIMGWGITETNMVSDGLNALAIIADIVIKLCGL